MRKSLLVYHIFAAAVLALAAQGCSDEVPMVSLGIDDSYVVSRMQKLPLHVALSGDEYRWSLTSPDGKTREVSATDSYIFLAGEEGEYLLTIEISDGDTPLQSQSTIRVVHEEVEYSPWIHKVYDYHPAPGQFINTMPVYEEGDTYETMLRKVEESIGGTADEMVSLGAFGGYVTFGFDHTVINHPGEGDFRIWGNAFYEVVQPDLKGGSSEPGIVMVSYDANCNGLPDDAWYELKGCAHGDEATIHGYSITYQRPIDNAPRKDVKWEDSEGASGEVKVNGFHEQGYFPAWVDAPTLSFSGTRLPDNAVDVSGKGTYFVLRTLDWGYVDNHPNDDAAHNSFDISNAIDANGFPVELPGVDFIRVYTAMNQYLGWVGETSTELSKARDLHL